MTWFESFAFAFGSIVCRSCMAVLDGSNSSTGDIDFVTVERRFDGYLRNILQGCVEESLVVGRGFPWYYRWSISWVSIDLGKRFWLLAGVLCLQRIFISLQQLWASLSKCRLEDWIKGDSLFCSAVLVKRKHAKLRGGKTDSATERVWEKNNSEDTLLVVPNETIHCKNRHARFLFDDTVLRR